MLNITIKRQNGMLQHMPIKAITDVERELARKKCSSDFTKGALLPGFDADEWVLNNQKKKFHIRFDYRRNEVLQCCANTGLSANVFIDDLKTITALRYGTIDPGALKNYVKYTIDEFVTSKGFTINSTPSFKGDGTLLNRYVEFLQLTSYVPSEYLRFCEECLEKAYAEARTKQRRKSPCTLTEFQSYFRFDHIIRDWWNKETRPEVKQYYYPLYIFWRITTVLPLRATEFCVTPWDCLRKTDTLYYLTIRRSKLKGSSSYSPIIRDYTIENDYKMFEYEITEELYSLIDEYRKLSSGYSHPYDTLFSSEYALSQQVGTLRSHSSDLTFTNEELNVLLQDFYQDVVVDQYGYFIVTENDLVDRYLDSDLGSYEMGTDEIMRILPKHTRHLAMINLIMRGCSPLMIKEFAGHADEAISANYYGNVSKTIRCATKMLYDRVKNRRSEEKGYMQHKPYNRINPLSLLIDESNDCISMDNGRCYSTHFAAGSVADCAKVDGKCIACPHFIADSVSAYETEADRVDQEMEYIMQMLRDPHLEDKMIEFQIKSHQLEADIKGLAARIWQQYERGEDI